MPDFPTEIFVGTQESGEAMQLITDQLVVEFATSDTNLDQILTEIGLRPRPRFQPLLPIERLERMRLVTHDLGESSFAAVVRNVLDRSEAISRVYPLYRGSTTGTVAFPLLDTVRVIIDDLDREELDRLLQTRGAIVDMNRHQMPDREDRLRLIQGGCLRYVIADLDQRESPAGLLAELARLQALESIEYAGLEWLTVEPTQSVPNDPYYSKQWHLPAIRAERAWRQFGRKPLGPIAILDKGFDTQHEDLAFDPVARYDTASGLNGQTQPHDVSGLPIGDGDLDPHGTHVAGIAAAIAGNLKGVVGVAPGATILPIRLSVGNWSAVDAFVAALLWAAKSEAKVLSISQSWISDPDIDAALTAAVNQYDTVVVVAAGNSWCQGTGPGEVEPNPIAVKYPANHPLTIAVGASDRDEFRHHFQSSDGERWASHYGPGLDVVAPGQGLWTTDPTGEAFLNDTTYSDYYARCTQTAVSIGDAAGHYFSAMNGTSGAAPQVAALAVALRSKYTLSAGETREVIRKTSRKVRPDKYQYSTPGPGGWNGEVGYGQIDACRALVMGKTVVSGNWIKRLWARVRATILCHWLAWKPFHKP